MTSFASSVLAHKANADRKKNTFKVVFCFYVETRHGPLLLLPYIQKERKYLDVADTKSMYSGLARRSYIRDPMASQRYLLPNVG